MKNSKLLFQDFIKLITIDEPREETESIAYLVLEKLFSLSQTDILSEKTIDVSEKELNTLIEITRRINQHEPVQYILGEAFFFGRKFSVNTTVLIPRPETEELVLTVLQSVKKSDLKILDIGTGSGCIPVTFALELPRAEVYATDVSEKALAVAKQNAAGLDAPVTFLLHDILQSAIPFSDLDVIVSNPPYVTLQEKAEMKSNVTEYEPHLALFTPENDPLIFYRAIAVKAKNALKRGGLLAVEINIKFASDVTHLFREAGFKDIVIIKDINRKERIVKALNA